MKHNYIYVLLDEKNNVLSTRLTRASARKLKSSDTRAVVIRQFKITDGTKVS